MVQQKVATMLSETVYTGITNLYLINHEKSTKHKAIHNKMLIVFFEKPSFWLLFESVYAVAAAKVVC